MLRSAVNRNLDTVFIDLDDLDTYCKAELQGPDSQGVDAMPKLGLQQSISSLTSDVEPNSECCPRTEAESRR